MPRTGRPKGRRKRLEIGSQFNRWTVIGDLELRPSNCGIDVSYQSCRCSCGTVRCVQVGDLKNGVSRSCGCLAAEEASFRFTKHGDCKIRGRPRLYSIWGDMRRRCMSKNYCRYKDWGGRGIRVCNEWMDYPTFKAWALTNGYAENLEIDRIDNDGHYEPGNCHWVNETQQAMNRRTTRIASAFGESKCLYRWSKDKRCAVAFTTLLSRIKKGWDIELAITIPPQ